MGLTESTERSSRFSFPTMSRLGSRLSPYRLGRKSGQSRMCTSLTSFKKACSSRLLEAVGPAPRLSAFIPRGEGFFFESCLGWVKGTLRATPSALALLGSGRGPRRSSLAGGLYQGFKGRAFSSVLGGTRRGGSHIRRPEPLPADTGPGGGRGEGRRGKGGTA